MSVVISHIHIHLKSVFFSDLVDTSPYNMTVIIKCQKVHKQKESEKKRESWKSEKKRRNERKGKQIAFGVSFTVSLGLGKHSSHSPWIERVNESERVRETKSISVELE